MIWQGIVKLLTLAFIGAILADVLLHPAGTRALGQTITGVLGTALEGASGGTLSGGRRRSGGKGGKGGKGGGRR